MKNPLMNLYDKILLRKREFAETVNDGLQNVCNIEYTRIARLTTSHQIKLPDLLYII